MWLVALGGWFVCLIPGYNRRDRLKNGQQACHQIIQRPEPIGSALEGCLIRWCIISGCLLCQFATGTTPNSQFQGPFLVHRIAMESFIGSLATTFTDPINNHFIFTLWLSFTQIVALPQLPMWHILNSFWSHFATFMDYLPISTQYNNISSPQVLMPSFSPKLRLNHLTNTIVPLSLSSSKMSWKWAFFFLSPNGGVCAFIRSDVQILVYLNLTSWVLVVNWSGWKFPYLILHRSFASYTAHLTQSITNCYLNIYLN